MPALLYVGDTYTEVVCYVRDISELETALISKHCLIRHITETGKKLIVGCYLADQEFARYVMHKEYASAMMKDS